MARGPQPGDRYGDWHLESRAKPVDGKRHWNVVNTVTDERRVVAQVDLKKLGSEPCPADDQCAITEEGHTMPSSAEITAKVVLANYKNDPFNIPDGFLPEDDTEYPFEPTFAEPEFVPVRGEVVDINADNPFEEIEGHDVIGDPEDDDFENHGWPDADETEQAAIESARKLVEELVSAMAESMHQFIDEWCEHAVKDISDRLRAIGSEQS